MCHRHFWLFVNIFAYYTIELDFTVDQNQVLLVCINTITRYDGVQQRSTRTELLPLIAIARCNPGVTL
ncbi:hypothetical protein ANTPLA_LOCUS2810 [Anthophora plagiata]